MKVKVFIFISLISQISAIITFGKSITPKEAISEVITSIAGDNFTEANFEITESNSNNRTRGTIRMQGNMMKITMPDIMIWYDGSTMWTYSGATDEVNITSPDADELALLSPYAALLHYEQLFDAKAINPGADAINTLLLTAKSPNNGQIHDITLKISNNSRVTQAIVKLVDNSKHTINLNNYKKGNKLPTNAFKFNKAEVPANTPVIDLR